MKLTILSKSNNKRPWVAQIKGVGWYSVAAEPLADDEFEPLPVRKLGFKLAWSGAGISQVFGQRNTYIVDFTGDGVFQVKVQGEGYRFYSNCGEEWREVRNPFPADWSQYMRSHRCSYEDVWNDVWVKLCHAHEQHACDSEEEYWTVEEIEDFMEGMSDE